MAGGLHFTPEQIRSLPLTMQIKIGLSIASQLAQATPVAGQEELERDKINALGLYNGKTVTHGNAMQKQSLGKV